jgi:hypothetical protein
MLIPRDGNGNGLPVLGLGAAHQVTLATGASARMADPVGAATSIVTVWADADFYIAVGGGNPTAAVTGFAWPAYTPLDLQVEGGVSKVAGRAITEAGTLFVSERA